MKPYLLTQIVNHLDIYDCWGPLSEINKLEYPLDKYERIFSGFYNRGAIGDVINQEHIHFIITNEDWQVTEYDTLEELITDNADLFL